MMIQIEALFRLGGKCRPKSFLFNERYKKVPIVAEVEVYNILDIVDRDDQ